MTKWIPGPMEPLYNNGRLVGYRGRPTRCICHWITHPCTGEQVFMEPHPECPTEEHRSWWNDYLADQPGA